MKRTITELENELEEIRKARKKGKYETGMFGFAECKKSIKWKADYFKKDFHQIYTELITRGLTEPGFNTFMIVACEELMAEENK